MIVKTMKHLAAPLLAAVAVFAQDPRVPIENDKVKVVKVTQDPHKKTSLHKHDMNRVMIYLQPGKQTFDYQGAKPKTITWKAGEALWSPAAGMHIAEIVSDSPVTIVELELKNKGTKEKVKGAATDPLKVAPKLYKVEFENDQVRVIRSKIGPKGTVPMHEHSLDRIVVYLTDQDFKITGADGKETMGKHKAGDVGFSKPATHKEENLSDKPFEILVVEFKG
jgi:quercetin dioxygenase-like cupin family protein